MLKLKRKIGIFIYNSRYLSGLKNVLIYINQFIFHFSEREHLVHYGTEDENLTYYIIRPRSNDEGLISTYFFVYNEVNYAIQKNYIPFIDFENFPCQYSVKRSIHGTNNAWEYFFSQPSSVDLASLYNKKNIILSGWGLREKPGTVINDISCLNNQKIHDFCKKYLKLNKYVLDLFQKRYSELFDSNETLGVFLRGTDYVALKPKGHWRQPEVSDVINKIQEFLNEYPIKRIFIVTEDYEIFSEIKNSVNCEVFSSDDSFIKKYDKDDYISNSFNDDPYERGLNYLVRLLLLTKCNYLISSLATGSIYSNILEKPEYIDCFWFNLGKY